MTAPIGAGNTIGVVKADLVIDAKRVPYDVVKHLERVGKDADKFGQEAGTRLAKGLAKGYEANRPDFDVGGGGRGGGIFGGRRRGGRDGELGSFAAMTAPIRRVGRAIGQVFKKIVDSPAAKSMLSLATTLGGRFFNMGAKGKAGLLLMLPLMATMLSFIVALIAAVQVLGALLLLLPAAIASIGLQVGVLMVAFQGVGDAISAAFAAKNAKEVTEAVKGLTPSAQLFVRALLHIKDVWGEIQKTAQESFFSETLGGIQHFVLALGSPQVLAVIEALGTGLGNVADAILRAFSSESFKKFLEVLAPAAESWLIGFATAIDIVAEGFSRISTTMMPFFSQVGAGLNNFLERFGTWLIELSEDPAFTQWLKDVWDLMLALGALLGAIVKWVFAFFKSLNNADLEEFVMMLAVIVMYWAEFLESPLGAFAMRGFLAFLLGLVLVMTILGTIIGIVAGAFYALGYAIGWILHLIGGFIASVISGLIAAWNKIKERIEVIVAKFKAIPEAFQRGFVEGLKAVANFVIEIAKTLRDAVIAGWNKFVEVGKQIGEALKEGIMQPVQGLGDTILEAITLGGYESETYNSGPPKAVGGGSKGGGGGTGKATGQASKTGATQAAIDALSGVGGQFVASTPVKNIIPVNTTTTNITQYVTVEAGAITTNVQTEASFKAATQLASQASKSLGAVVGAGLQSVVRNIKPAGYK